MVFVRNSCPSYPQFNLVPEVLSLPTSKDPGLSCKGKFSTRLQPSSFAYFIKATVTRAKRASGLATLLKRCCTLYYPHLNRSCKKSGFCKSRKVFPGRKNSATNKYSHVTRFTSPRQNCFAASDVTQHQCTA